jgi:hypothetical protein
MNTRCTRPSLKARTRHEPKSTPMKYSLLIAALSLGLIALPPAASARDWERDFYFESDRDLHVAVGHLREHYEHVAIDLDHAGARGRERLHEIKKQINDISAGLETGNFKPERVREKIHGIHEELHRLLVEYRSTH